MTIDAEGEKNLAEQLSALTDGEAAPSEVSALCAQWRDDEVIRARWHRYQMIGDVLRSEDLASTAAHDSAFLSRLRERLEHEPVVLAPAALTGVETPPVETMADGLSAVAAAATRPRRRWAAASVAAGFMVVVAAAMTLTRTPAPQETIARGPAAMPSVVAANTAPALPATAGGVAPGEPQILVADGRLIRDARLDRYLAAHQQWSGGSMIGGHAAYLRHVAADAPKR